MRALCKPLHSPFKGRVQRVGEMDRRLEPQPVEGITVHDSEVLEPEPVRTGGLMRKDTVRILHLPRIPFDG